MAAPSTYSDLLNKATGGSSGTPEKIWVWKGPRDGSGTIFAPSAGAPTSYWMLGGSPGHGVAPGGTARNPTNATDGSLKQTNPSGGRKKWLVAMQASHEISATGAMVVLYDRLADISGFNATSSALQTITGLSVNRYTGTDAIGNQIWVEIYVSVGATPQTLTVTYTNENGVQHTTSVSLGGNAQLRQTMTIRPVALVSGDRGVRSVDSIQLSGSTSTAGNYGITIVRPLAYVGFGATIGVGTSDLVSGPLGLVEIATNACLMLAGSISASASCPLNIGFQFVES